MIAGNHNETAREPVLGAMREDEARSRRQLPGPLGVAEQSIEGNAAQTHDNAQILKQAKLFVEPGCAVELLLRRRFVGWRSAANHSADPQVSEFHAVVAGDGFRFRGKASFMQHRKQKIARSVAGEGPPGAVGSVCPRRQAQRKHARPLIAERGHRLAPVLPIGIGAAADTSHFGAVFAQPRTTLARNDSCIQSFQ